MRHRKRRSTNPVDQLIEYGRQWIDAIHDNNFDKALAIREEAETLFEQLPGFRDKPKFGRSDKVLRIQWDWFSNYLKPETREFYHRCRRERKSANHQAKMENFTP